MAREKKGPFDVPETLEGIREWLRSFRADHDSHTHDGSNSRKFQTLLAETLAARALSIRKTSFTDNTSGMWAGLVGNTMKLFIGTASAYLKWTGTALQIAGDIVAGSLTIGNNASIDSSGNATFISMASLNMKAYTSFEDSGRFILTGDVAPTFGNNGMIVAPGTTANHYARGIWRIMGYVFNNNPSFTCAMVAQSGFEAGDGRAFVGLGAPTISGSALTTTSVSIAGFRFQKVSGTTTVLAINNNGDVSNTTETSLITVANNDVLELMIKFTSTSIKYYYRKNGGTLTLGATHTTRIPTASDDQISFMSTNSNTTDDFILAMRCAAYEH